MEMRDQLATFGLLGLVPLWMVFVGAVASFVLALIIQMYSRRYIGSVVVAAIIGGAITSGLYVAEALPAASVDNLKWLGIVILLQCLLELGPAIVGAGLVKRFTGHGRAFDLAN